MASGINIHLRCGHVVLLFLPIPHVGDSIWCTKCDVPREVIHTEEWFTRCQKCRYSRFAGNSESLAKTMATRHWRKTGHTTNYGRYPSDPITVGHDDVTESSLDVVCEST